MNNFEALLTTKEFFSLEEIDFGLNRLENGKTKDTEGYQAEILNIGGPVLIPHIYKLFNQAVKQGFPKPWTESLIIPIFKSVDTNNPSNYRTIMINPLLARLYGLKVKVSRIKAMRVLEYTTQQQTTLLCLGSVWRNVVMINPISFVALWSLERLSIRFLETNFRID